MSMSSHTSKFAPPPTDDKGRVSLIGMDFDELQTSVESGGLPKFRAKQLWNWIYHRGVKDFSNMENLPKNMRDQMSKTCSLDRPVCVKEQKSKDGTLKWLLEMTDGERVEVVYIPEDKRGTLCISAQVGCTLSCKFCHTGTQPLTRNLSAAEIVQQIMFARDKLEEWPEVGERVSAEDKELTNIVLMGMGEPFYNYDNVSKAIKICMDDNGLNISKRRITLSTSGIVPFIKQCGEELGVNLAISLHAPNDEIRSKIMPVNKKYPIAELLDVCRNYPGISEFRRITFEYLMLKGFNDADKHARELAKLLRDIPCKINIIPFNPWEGSDFKRPDDKRIRSFVKVLEMAGYDVPVRRPRGEDIMAACGQLKSSECKDEFEEFNE